MISEFMEIFIRSIGEIQLKTRMPAANSRLPQVAVTWLVEGSCSYQSLVQVDSEVLFNRHLRQATKL